jgi:hypothetical protein
VRFRLPDGPYALTYDVVLDTCAERPGADPGRVGVLAGSDLAVPARSVVLLRANR